MIRKIKKTYSNSENIRKVLSLMQHHLNVSFETDEFPVIITFVNGRESTEDKKVFNKDYSLKIYKITATHIFTHKDRDYYGLPIPKWDIKSLSTTTEVKQVKSITLSDEDEKRKSNKKYID